jgi:putative selenium metabolism protein SsnA
MSLLLTGGTVVRQLDPPEVERADLRVVEGRIAPVGVAGLGSPSVAEEALDCSGCLILPGNVNAHTHAYSALARGMPFRLEAPRTFLEILQRVWWRLDRALDPTAIRASALVAAHEALRSGTTSLVDHHASPNAIDGSLDVIAEAFEEVGIRSVLCYEASDRDGSQRARDGVEENARFIGRVAEGRWPLSRAMVGAHASFTLSEATLDACLDLAARTGSGLHIHAAEDAVDQADAVARFGRRAVQRLADAGGLNRASLLAHAVHVDPAEAELIRAAGATVAHNPRSNMNNGVGRTPLDWIAGHVALGTDGIGADMLEESRAAYLRRREESLEATPRDALQMLSAGARLAGRAFGEPQLGTLAAGAPADLVVLDYDPPTAAGADQLDGHWIFGLSSAHVRHVVVNGEPVLRDRRPTRIDPTELAIEARRAARLLWERLEGIGPHTFEPTRLLATLGSE